MLLQVFRELFPVFAALYLIDAVAYVRRSQVLFAPRPLGGFVLKERGLRLASLWPGGFAFVSVRPTVLPARDGVYLLEAEDGPARYDPASWKWTPWADLPAPALDADVTGRLAELRRLDPAQRERRIGEIEAAAFSLERLEERR